MKILSAACFLVLVWMAVNFKIKLKMGSFLGKRGYDLPVELKESLFSRAVVELVATAGGIYVSLTLLLSFLNIAVPGEIVIAGVKTDTLAALSLVIALAQPIAAYFLNKIVL